MRYDRGIPITDGGQVRFRNTWGVLAVVVLICLTAVTPTALGASPQSFWTRCANNSAQDVQCSGPRGIATSPIDGHVYVADSFNRRIAEFSVWGIFIKAWGWDVVQSGPDDTGTGFEICVAAQGDVCKEGTTGAGAGQFGSPQGIAVDSAGSIYVVDRGLPSNQRVQKFSPSGQFLFMWGKGVNEGTAVNKDICTNAGPPGQVCKAGEVGTASGQFGELAIVGNYIAIDTLGTVSASDDRVYVGDKGRVQRFNINGEYQSEIALPGETVSALTVDSSSNLYASFCGLECVSGQAAKANVRKWNSAGLEQPAVTVADPQGLAADAAGDLYVLDGASNPTVREFSPVGTEILDFAFSPGSVRSTGISAGSTCLNASTDLYVANSAVAPDAFVRAFGPPPDKLTGPGEPCEPPSHAPEIEGQGALSVETDNAIVQATINPRFWNDTSYYVQYANAACIEVEGWEAPCVSQKPASPAQLGAGATDVGVNTAKIFLAGLAPETSYTYRFVAKSSGGGPVFGKGGTEVLEGKAASFTTTTAPPGSSELCPNKDFRSGAGAFLPDCRAYEMVSPVDKNGGDIRPDKETYFQSSPDGGRITYGAQAAFGDQPSNKIFNQYLATREENGNHGGGWLSRGINAPLGRQLGAAAFPNPEVSLFSPDLCSEWLIDYNAIPLASTAPAGFANLYRQDLCGASGFEPFIQAAPSVVGGVAVTYVRNDSIQGFSEDLKHVFFVAQAGLTPDAVQGATNRQIYDYSGGELHLVSVLPDGTPDPGQGTTGAAVGGGALQTSGGNEAHAVSSDGSRVFWTSKTTYPSQGGTVFLREHPEQGIVAGECSEAGIACTIPVSSGFATFWTATPSGSAALYSEGDLSNEAGKATLYRFDVESQTRTPLAEHVLGVLGASEDLSRIYYISTDVLTPGQPNDEGDEALAGKPNLYLDEEGELTFIGTLLGGPSGDVAGGVETAEVGPGATYRIGSFNPRYNAVRVTADGNRIAFQSRASLTGFDNTDANSGKADVEVFTYEAGGAVVCISCNPSGVRPSGRELPKTFHYVPEDAPTEVWAAAWIPGWEHALHASNVLSSNGERLFFNSYAPLVSRDTNGAEDVYEWEAAGEGRCDEESHAYHEMNGGCVYLISTGESPFESLFWEASPDGRDVFFTTESSLVPQDPGSIDLYDAREGGGFVPASPSPECEGEACQGSPGAPNDPTPASSGFEVAESKPGCAKGKVRRNGRCVAKKHRKRVPHRAKHNRGGAR